MKRIPILYFIIVLILAGCNKKADKELVPEPEEYVKWHVMGRDFEISTVTQPASYLFAVSDTINNYTEVSASYHGTEDIEFLIYLLNLNKGEYNLTHTNPRNGAIRLMGNGILLTASEFGLLLDIKEYGKRGEYIRGNFAGEASGTSLGSPIYDVSGTFKIRIR